VTNSPSLSEGGEVAGGVDDYVGVAGEVVHADVPRSREGRDVGVGADFIGGEVQVGRGGGWVEGGRVTVRKLLVVAVASVTLMTAAVGLESLLVGIPA